MRMAKPRKLKSGHWRIQMRLNGQSFSFTAPTKTECELMAMQARTKHAAEPIVKPSELTLSEAIDRYIERRSNVISPSTTEGYRVIQRNRFKSSMNRRICDVKDWQKIVNDEAQAVSAKTLKNAWSFVSSVLKENRARVDSIKLPQVVPNEHPFLEPEQIKTFLAAVEGDKYELPILLGLHGLRRSEVLALTKGSIKDGYILVRGAVVHDAEKGFVKKETNKNQSSRRNVPILIERVASLTEQCETEQLCPWNPSIIYRRVNQICKENNLPEIGFHGLRHSFASLCYHLGLSEMETMRLGGWNDPAVMRKIYTHLAQSDLSEGEKKLQAFFR